jgi:hypothetical protein
MDDLKTTLIFLAGIGQLGVLLASAQVPLRLKWTAELRCLPPLHRNLCLVYGGYLVLSIVAFGLISIFNAAELAGGTSLARWLCGYIAIFWAARLALVKAIDMRPYLTSVWLKLGYALLLVLFAGLVGVYGWAAFCQRSSP